MTSNAKKLSDCERESYKHMSQAYMAIPGLKDRDAIYALVSALDALRLAVLSTARKE